MKGTAIILKPGEAFELATRFPFIDPPSLEFLQSAVGGKLGAVLYWERCMIDHVDRPVFVYCNKDGRLKGLAPNLDAQRLWRVEQATLGAPPHPVIVGPVVILFGDAEFMEAL